MARIKRKDFVKALKAYQGKLLLVGIDYNKDKKHTCVIERMEK